MARQVFEGVKVADFSWVAAGPQIGRELADHGANVVRVESHRRPDMTRQAFPFKDGKSGWNRSAYFAAFNAGKYGISLNLRTDRGKAVARRLVAWADVLTESMMPGAMADLGLSYESCRKVNPALIYCSTTQMGQTGPNKGYVGVGFQTNGMLGICHTTGWPDSDPTLPLTPYTDYIAPWYALVAIIGALARRHRTGEGMYIDQSQYEAGLHAMAPHLMDYMVNGNVINRMGNRDRYLCPHGIYPCVEGRHVAIAIAGEEEWTRLCEITGHPEWMRDPRFITVASRKQNEDELDRLIGDWTKDFPAEHVMAVLQDAGVPAGAVQGGQEVMSDPQLKHRGHYQVLDHPEIGPHSYNSPAYRLSRTPGELKRPAPCLGEHNLYVYKELLGMSDDEIAEMVIDGTITTEVDGEEAFAGGKG
jgi:benzylsuccinate CoA-transferase BbsF subunit